MSICGFSSIFLKIFPWNHRKPDLLAHWSYFCRCVCSNFCNFLNKFSMPDPKTWFTGIYCRYFQVCQYVGFCLFSWNISTRMTWNMIYELTGATFVAVQKIEPRDPIFKSVCAPNRSKFNWCCACLDCETLLSFAMGDVECFTVSPPVHFWASEMGPVLYMFRLWSSLWPVPNRLLRSLSTSAITNPQPHTCIGIVEWGLYWSSLPCSYHRTFMKLAPDIHLMKCLLLISLVKMAAELPRPPGLLSGSVFLKQSLKRYWEWRRDDSQMLATICDDTWNVHNMQHILPNLKRWDYSDIPGGGHKYIKGPIWTPSTMRNFTDMNTITKYFLTPMEIAKALNPQANTVICGSIPCLGDWAWSSLELNNFLQKWCCAQVEEGKATTVICGSLETGPGAGII